MSTKISNLSFRRQFILTPGVIDCPFQNRSYTINSNAVLYTHVDLVVTDIIEGSRRLILLGDLFDYENIKYGNYDILKNLVKHDFSSLMLKLSKYCGRFVLIYIENNSIYLIHDAAASRKIYYIKRNDGVYCASQPHLIAKILRLELTRDKERLDFYTAQPELLELLHNSNIGNTTCYDDVYQVMPNHYFDVNQTKCIRYWPNAPKKEIHVDEVAERLSVIIKGNMESICNRYSVMLPVTAGKDSRVLLAASSSVRDKVFYYLNKETEMSYRHLDLVIPSKLLPKLNLKFNILDPYGSVDEEFERIYFENDPFASKPFLPIVHNYYKNFSDKINIPGTFSETGLTGFVPTNKPLDANELAKFIMVDYNYAKDYYHNWLKECKDVCNSFKYDPLMLFYWEERIGNWGTQIQLFKDIAQEEIIPYNSHLMMETMQMAPLKYRDNPDYLVMRMVAQKLWPETLQLPVNPNTKMKILSFTRAIGFDQCLKSIYYLTIFPRLKLFNEQLIKALSLSTSR